MSDLFSIADSTAISSECGLAKAPPEALENIASFFKTLSEVSRLRIVCTLKSGEKNVSQIIDATGLGQANVSKHLKLLTQAGIVERRPDGINVYYAIANPMVFSLCDLACNALAAQMQQKNQHLEALKSLQQSF